MNIEKAINLTVIAASVVLSVATATQKSYKGIKEFRLALKK